MKIHSLFCVLFSGACAALLATQVAAAGLAREHLSLDANWKFHLGDDWPDALHLENSGTGTGPASEKFFDTSAAAWSRSLFNGLAQVIVQSTTNAGELKLTATADGLAPATAVVQTETCTPHPSVP